MLKHFYDYEVTCMQVSIVCMDNGIQSDSIVTTQCEHACIYAIGVQTVKDYFNACTNCSEIRPQNGK